MGKPRTIKEEIKNNIGISRKECIVKKIAKAVGISEKTLQKLKNKHVEFSRAFSKSELDQKDDPIGAIYKKTMGFEHEDIQTQMEDYNGKPKLRNLKT